MPHLNTRVEKTLSIAELFQELDIGFRDFQVTAHATWHMG